MEPKLSLTIPSIHDDLALDCRLYYSTSGIAADGQSHARGAIIAHPYAPLGGCYDDPVVCFIVSTMLQQSFGFMCTFNFRGAPGSAGRTSWTGKAERADFESVVIFMIEYLLHCEVHQTQESVAAVEPNKRRIQLVLGGYSYGSWICTHLSDPLEVWRQAQTAIEGSAAAEIKARALHLSAQVNEELSLLQQHSSPKHGHTLTVGGEETSPDKRRRSGEHSNSRHSIDFRRSLDMPRKLASLKRKNHRASSSPIIVADQQSTVVPGPAFEPVLEPAYLLVSPLLPPISSLTTLPFGMAALKSHDEGVRTRLSTHTTLSIFGDDDMFTSSSKLRKWANDICSLAGSRFQFVEVHQAGHFWTSSVAQKALKAGVKEWVRGLIDASLRSESEQAPDDGG